MSEKEYMNIAIALNDNFMFPTRVMLHSLCRHASRPINFILMYNDLTVTNRKILRNLVESYDNTIRELFIEKGRNDCHCGALGQRQIDSRRSFTQIL